MRESIVRLLPYVRRARRPFVLGLGCAVLATAVQLASPLVLERAVNDLTAGFNRSRLAFYAALILAIAVADGGFRYLMRMWLIGASRQIEYDLRNDFFAHLERLPLGYFHGHRTGDLMSRAINDLSAVRMMVGPAVMYVSSTLVGFVVALALMLSIDARLTLLSLLPLPLVSVATHYFGGAIHARFERIQAQLSDMSAVVQESLAGVRVVRAYGQEAHQLAGFQRSNDEYVARNERLIRLQSAFYPSLTLCFGVSAVVMLWLGGRDVIAHRLNLGQFVALGRFLVMLSWPMIAFGWVINIAQRGLASWGRMREVLDAPPAPGLPPADAAAAAASAPALASSSAGLKVEVRRLTFRYPTSADDVLHDVTFTIGPGETVAIVGPTGSGKSTMVGLLPRLYEPPRGAILVDGLDALDWPIDQLRSAIGLVPQEPFLFSETLAGNIAFGLPAGLPPATVEARVREAAYTACLDAEVASFPQGYDTPVGERGITLSGGQKQRTAIARAVAVEPRLLILDDALSAVDTQTEETMLRRLAPVRGARSCLIIAHRVSTVRDADRILVLVDGRIVERGTHDELVARGGVYAGMHRRQLLEAELMAE